MKFIQIPYRLEFELELEFDGPKRQNKTNTTSI